jgi:hypothetical protein
VGVVLCYSVLITATGTLLTATHSFLTMVNAIFDQSLMVRIALSSVFGKDLWLWSSPINTLPVTLYFSNGLLRILSDNDHVGGSSSSYT